MCYILGKKCLDSNKKTIHFDASARVIEFLRRNWTRGQKKIQFLKNFSRKKKFGKIILIKIQLRLDEKNLELILFIC